MELDDSLYLDDHWEYRMHCGGYAAKLQGTWQFKAGKVWATIPREAVWVFPAWK